MIQSMVDQRFKTFTGIIPRSPLKRAEMGQTWAKIKICPIILTFTSSTLHSFQTQSQCPNVNSDIRHMGSGLIPVEWHWESFHVAQPGLSISLSLHMLQPH